MIEIRDVTMADIPYLLNIYAPYVEETAISFEYVIPTDDEFAHRVYYTIQRYPYLVAEKGGVIVGYAYATEFKEREAFQWSVETSVYVKRNERHCGIGRMLYNALESELRKRGFQSMCACIAYTNDKEDPYLTNDSVLFHNKMGFSKVAHFHHCGWKFLRWYDIVWMEKLL
jgi:phosphinothricin acetyltransferase